MQVPAQFDYARATSVADALALLARYGPESRVVAGGHSLIPMMKLRLAQPEVLVDINDLTELARITVEGTDLVVGAMTRHADLLDSALVREHFAILADAERVIADPIVRNRGTVGGSLCQADPSEDLSAAFGALRATAVVQGPDGTRTVPVREFHTGPYETVVGPGELLVEVRIPIRPGGGSSYQKVERRAGDWAVAAADGTVTAPVLVAGEKAGGGAAVWLDDAGATVTEVGIGLTAVGAEHFVAGAAEDFLRGAAATDENFAEAGRIAAEHCHPSADQRGPVDYKRHLAGELTTRALRRAAARARGQEG